MSPLPDHGLSTFRTLLALCPPQRAALSLNSVMMDEVKRICSGPSAKPDFFLKMRPSTLNSCWTEDIEVHAFSASTLQVYTRFC